MDDILEAYRRVQKGDKNHSEVYSYENIHLHFGGGLINLFDFSGEMPCGRYRLPPNEQRMLDFLVEYSEKIGQMSDNNQFICGKCGGTFDLPEATRDRLGAYICDVCADGGDIRKEREREKKALEGPQSTKDNPPPAGPVSIPSTVSRSRLTTEEAISFLKEQGYVVKK